MGKRAFDRVVVWALPVLALALAVAAVLACVLVHGHVVPIDAAYRASDEYGRGVLRAPPADVGAAERLLGVTWIAALPAAMAVTLLAASAVDRFRAEGGARVFASTMTLVGLIGCVVGTVLAVVGVLELLAI